MKQHYLSLSDDPYIFDRAVLKCFEGKYRRNDVLSFIEKYAGIPRNEVLVDELTAREADKNHTSHYPIKLTVARDVGIALEEIVSEIFAGFEPEDFKPVLIRQRRDGANGKIRDIALLCILHQLIEHLTFNLLEPLFKAKLKETQHASIPGHGQTRLKNQVYKFLKGKSGIRYAKKIDGVKAYKSIKYRKVIELVKRDAPRATDAITLLTWLGNKAPNGSLIIGGYLDAWLFNYVMSDLIEVGYAQGSFRRGKFLRHAKKIITFMDDALILSSSIKALNSVIKAIFKAAKVRLGLNMRETTGDLLILSAGEEKIQNGSIYTASRGATCIDMAGYRIFRTHTTIRKTLFIRIRRCFLRAKAELDKTGTIRIQRARSLVSYYGHFKQTNSAYAIAKYDVERIMAVAKRIISNKSRYFERIRMEELYDLRERACDRSAVPCDLGIAA